MKLTVKEQRVYDQIIKIIPTLVPGKTYHPKDLFKGPCNARIVRHLREEIVVKNVPLTLVGKKISEGVILQLS